MKYYRKVSGDREVVVQTDGVKLWVLHHSKDKSMEGKCLSNPYSDLAYRGDWVELPVKVGSVWVDRVHGLEYKIHGLRDDCVMVTWFAGCHQSGTMSYKILVSKLDPREWVVDDDPSYTEGYRSGHTGLRWL